MDTVREKVFPCIETHFIKEKSLLEHALFREVILQACVRGGKSATELIIFVMEAGIENVRDANLLEDPKRCVHETTLESMEKYCEDVHGGEAEKMLKAMVLSCNGNVRGGATMVKLIIFVRETGIENVRVSKSLADLKCYVHPTTMDSMVNHCEDVHKRDEEMMMKAMDSVQSRGKKAADIRWMQE